MATDHLHFYPTNPESAVGHLRPLVPLVGWRGPRARVGIVSTHSLFFGRNDRYHRSGVFLRQQFFQLDVTDVLISGLRAFLSGGNYLHLFHSAGQNQMAGVDCRRIFVVGILR